MRTITAFLAIAFLPSVLTAQNASSETRSVPNPVEFELGVGTSDSAAAIAPVQKFLPDRRARTSRVTNRFSPHFFVHHGDFVRLGGITLFANETTKDGQEVLRLGTSLTRGRATTGLNLTYNDDNTVEDPEVFVDFSVASDLQVGLTGGLTELTPSEGEFVGRFGLNALVELGDSAIVQGEISDTLYSKPELGIAFGFKF